MIQLRFNSLLTAEMKMVGRGVTATRFYHDTARAGKVIVLTVDISFLVTRRVSSMHLSRRVEMVGDGGLFIR
jgi:hypothetical protein